MFGLVAWGLDQYPLPRSSDRHRLDIGPNDLYFQNPDLDEERNGVAFEFWPFSRAALAASRIGSRTMPAFRHRHYANQFVEFLILDRENPVSALGLVATALPVDMGSATGVQLSSPSDLRLERALMAISPPPHAEPLPSADYQDAYPGLPASRRTYVPPIPEADTRLVRSWGRRR
jgi:hypothetical protein